ncbi:MAG: DUF2809 domain-containing protein [Actinobacteria bacterium]|nr:DUF2809 domain-containing protein [Actinomycetota bacterium]MCG2800557.1 DUF2809 domain-containing protein [Cellulomonas sp.]
MRSATTRSRPLLVLGAAATIAVGLVAHRLPGLLGDMLGGALYAVLIYLLLAVLRPAARPVVLAVAALAVCTVVELAQLTDGPRTAVAAVPVLRLVLGTTFSAPDLLAYALGAVGAGGVDALATIRMRRAQTGA